MTMSVPLDERFSLRVRNLPAVLSTEAITSLLTHYGATRVRVLQRRNAASSGKEPGAAASKKLQKAVATFATREAQQNAQRRLHSLELAGHHLQVEVIGDEAAATTSTEAKPEVVGAGRTLPLQGQPPLPKGLPPPLPPTPAPVQNPLYAPAPLAPHLGLHYAPSPLLEYKYPKATEGIVRNIANALIALPRFYTQVLHLMNKTNLPPPFEDDAIPGRFSIKPKSTEQDSDVAGAERQNRKRPRTGNCLSEQIVEEEEEEDEEEDEHAVKTGDHKDTQAFDVYATQMLESGERTNVKDPNFFRHSSPATNDSVSRPELIGKPLVRQTKLSVIKNNAALHGAFQLGAESGSSQEVHQPARPGVISKSELERQRVAPEDLLKEPLLASYSRGSPSNTVLVKNIARGVDEKDLRFVFGYVLPSDSALDSMKITLSTATGSASITYPNEAMATAAVDELHGLQLEGRMLIVSYHQNALPDSLQVMPTVQPWTLEQLASKRLTDAQLAGEKVMKKYQRGEPSDTLYVKNLAKAVELADLLAVFSAVLPPESGPEILNIRHFTEGRMKCQAFVTYPTVELASSALLQVHGVVLKEKPLIVCFRKA